jgi:hypothetical protein
VRLPSRSEARCSAPEPFPQRKHFHNMPKGTFSLKKEIHFEKLLMITQPGEITFQVKYDNNVDFYLEGGKRFRMDSWTGTTTSHSITITIE